MLLVGMLDDKDHAAVGAVPAFARSAIDDPSSAQRMHLGAARGLPLPLPHHVCGEVDLASPHLRRRSRVARAAARRGV